MSFDPSIFDGAEQGGFGGAGPRLPFVSNLPLGWHELQITNVDAGRNHEMSAYYQVNLMHVDFCKAVGKAEYVEPGKHIEPAQLEGDDPLELTYRASQGKYFIGNIKDFLRAACDGKIADDSVEGGVRDVRADDMDAAYIAASCTSDQPLSGARVFVRVYEALSQKGKHYRKAAWYGHSYEIPSVEG